MYTRQVISRRLTIDNHVLDSRDSPDTGGFEFGGPHRNRTGLQIRRVFPTKCFHFQYVDGRWYREWYRECCYSECNEMVRNNSRHPRNPE